MTYSTAAARMGTFVVVLVAVLYPPSATEANTQDRPRFLRVDSGASIHGSENGLFVPGRNDVEDRALMTSAETGMCSNGIIGVEGFGYCCRLACETCGGSSCRDQARAADLSFSDCCTGAIEDVCSETNAAPCFIDDFPIPSPAPTVEMSMCSNGFPGIQTGNVCCPMECGFCGGRDCGDAPGGPDSCCTNRILTIGSSCSDVDTAPCFIVENEPTPTPTMMLTIEPTMEMSTCSNGFTGIQTDNVCCTMECGQCGGMNCEDATGGADSCCTSRILTNGSPCGLTGEAPCFITEPTPSPTAASTCSNGMIGIQSGNVCCDVECGLCGGMNCSDAPGGSDSCCTARILNTGSPCGLTGDAPCFIQGQS